MNYRLILMQAVFATAGFAFSLHKFGYEFWPAGLYGAAVALLSTWWLTRGVSTAGQIAETDPKRGVYMLYFGAVQRFVFVLVALGVGLAALKLKAEPLLLTFAVAQLAYFISGRAKLNS